MKQRVPFIRSFLGHNSRSRFFSTTELSKFDEQLEKARRHAKIGQSKEADSLYREMIRHYPNSEIPYREIFQLWCQNRSVLGLHKEEIDWLASEYQSHFSPDDSAFRKAT